MLKQLALSLAESPWFVRALAQVGSPSCTTVFMHRFAENREHEGRHDPRRLRQVLSELRRAGVALVELDEAIGYTAETAASRRKIAVSFTVDDGYADFAEFAWPVFKEFECPVSLFVVPGAINGDIWFWWDKIDWSMRNHPASRISLPVGDARFEATWKNDRERGVAFERGCAWLKQWPATALEDALLAYASELTEPLPDKAPPEYRVLSWNELRKLEKQGLRIGAHTMTHPVLSRCEPSRARWEVEESVRLVAEHVANPLPVFCYPNGQPADHGVREWELVSGAGVPYAMTTTGGVLRSAFARTGIVHWQHQLPRIGFQLRAGQILREFLT